MGKMGKPTPNYYDMLGCNPQSTEKEILKAYRKKALTCHPDKNPDNPKAADIFIQVAEAFKILTDPAAKAAFDKVLKAKEKAKLRTQAYDVKRRKFKDDLEKRENAAQQDKETDIDAAEKLAAEIKRLREEGSRLLQEQQDLVEKQLREESKNKSADQDLLPKLKVKWKAKKVDHQNGGYDQVILKEIFQQFGDVTAIVISVKKNGLAIVEYAKVSHAKVAMEFATGVEENPLTVTWLMEPSSSTPSSSSTDAEERPTTASDDSRKNYGEKTSTKASMPVPQNPEVVQPTPSGEDDFEAMVLKRMRQAQERKRLNEQLQDEDSKEGGVP